MSNKNNFKILFEEEERHFEESGLREEIDRNLNQRFAFLRLFGDLTELFTVRVIDILIMMSDKDIEPGIYFTPALKTDLEAALDNLVERDVNQTLVKLKELIDERSEKYQTLLSLQTQIQHPSTNPGEGMKQDANFLRQLKGLIASLNRGDLK